MGRSGQKPAGTATTQVQLVEQLLQRTPTAYHFKHLVLGRVRVRVRPGIKKKKKKERKKQSVSLLILEARMNFLFDSSRRGSTLEFHTDILLKYPSTP